MTSQVKGQKSKVKGRQAKVVAVLFTIGFLLLTSNPAAQQAPRIDPQSASIYGRITAADTGAPIRRAEVRLLAEGGGVSRLATTDADGRYELRDLPAGAYRLTASRSGFVTLNFGQRRPAEAFTAIALAEGLRLAANLALPRGGAIAGRVVDDAGEPIAEVRVQAMRARVVDGRRRVMPAGVTDVTDDTGGFRLFGLEPGDYYVAAMVRAPNPEDATMSAITGPIRGDIRAAIPVFYPGVSAITEAQPVSLGVSAEARADIFLAPLRTARVSGVVIDSMGRPAPRSLVELRSDLLHLGFNAMYAGPPPMSISAHAEADGSFELPNVPPGSYTLIGRIESPTVRGFLDAMLNAGPDAPSLAALKEAMMLQRGEVASMPLVVSNGDVAGLTLTGRQPATLTARFVADAGVTRPLPRQVEIQADGVQTNTMDHFTSRTQSAEIRLAGLFGPTRLRVVNLPDDWMVESIVIDGTDVTDAPIDFRGGNVEARVVLTDRITEVNGVIAAQFRDGRGQSPDASDAAYVVVFAADSSRWTYPSRFVRSARTDSQGSFRISGLPPHERYLAVAVDYLEEGEGEDPQFLERIRSQAVPFSLSEGERRTIDVRLMR